jgi:outer membrane lipoprotein-sorting protein
MAVLSAALARQPSDHSSSARLTAIQIVQKNIEARGGLAAWRAIDSVTMIGKIAIGKNDPQISFVLDVKRPGKARIKVQFNGQTAVHVYDGENAWKVMPFLDRYDAEPYPTQEMDDAPAGMDLEGPLMDYEAKRTFVELEGMEKVEDRNAYRLRLTMKEGTVRRIWVDAQTFLDVKVDASPRRLNGQLRAVATYYRDYRPVRGLMIPHLFETAVEGVTQTEKVSIEEVAINPKLDDKLFMKPE